MSVTQDAGIDPSDSDVWQFSDLRVLGDGIVRGTAYTHQFRDGYDVRVAVTSYEYEQNGKTRMNHVPNVVVSDGDGSIIVEPHARDTSDPREAITNAKQTAERVFHYPDQFI